MINPLLTPFSLPPFSAIRNEDILPALQSAISNCRAEVKRIVAQSEPFTWDNLCQPLADADERLSRIYSPVMHLNSVKNSLELRTIYEKALSELSGYSTWFSQNEKLYQAYRSLKEGSGFSELNISQRKSVENVLRDFKLSGINLSSDKQQRYSEIILRLSELGSAYSNNVLDATMGWSKLITEKPKLSGLPSNALAQAKEMALDKKQDGWLITLDLPTYLQVQKYADNRMLREEVYQAFVTRASDQGPNSGKWDNSLIMSETLALRHELSQLLGFKNYAEKSLATKMAESPQDVISFLDDLIICTRPQAACELEQLQTFAKEHYGLNKLEAWDITYYSEKQKKYLFSFSEEHLRQYFPEDRVLQGLFKIVKRIYGVFAKNRSDVDTWHSDVRFFDLFDIKGKLRGSFYLDLYARENKQGGAWMNDCLCSLRKADGTLQKPVAYITCNFNRPIGDKPALFTHNEVVTLFHEFGHGLHHILTEIDTPGVSGISGVPWDAVEVPSQFMENWCWEPEALAFISGHYQNDTPLSQTMINNLLAAKNYQSAMFVLRQLELSLFDFLLHFEYSPAMVGQIPSTLAAVQKRVSILPSPSWGRFTHAFSHIFSGGYAAGYYSYLWAEVLSADAYSRFREEGIFNPKTGISFLKNILSRGGSEEPMTLFQRFMGRAPQLDAMLRHYGIKRIAR